MENCSCIFIMKIFWLSIFTISSFGQVSSVVYDAELRGGIAYASIWVRNKNAGAVADSLGRFRLNGISLKDSLTISALGYENKSVVLSHSNDTVFLESQAFVLEEVQIMRSRKRKHKIGTLDAPISLIADFSESDKYENRLILARSFTGYDSGGYIGKVSIKAYARYKGQQFVVSLREIGNDGLPGRFLNDTPFIYAVKQGKKRLLKFDLSEYRIKVPPKGFYVTFEKYHDGIADVSWFGPFIAMAKNPTIKGTLKWGIKDGRWQWYYFDRHEIIMEVEFTD